MTPKQKPLHNSEVILFVEDESELQEITAKALREHGYEVITASNGEDALGILVNQGSTIHLVITDLVMPKVDGFELVRHMRQLGISMKILFQSAYIENVNIQDWVDVGKISFLEKPYSVKELLLAVRKILRS